MDLKMYLLDKSEKLGIDNKNLTLMEFRNLLLQEVKESEIEIEKIRIYKNCSKKAQKHRILLAQELLDVIQICITGLMMLARDGIDLKLQLLKHNYKLINDRQWKCKKFIEMRVRENVSKNY